MSTHTPGPWSYRAKYNGSKDEIGNEAGRMVCTVWVREPATRLDPDTPTGMKAWLEGEANARLIAAAPLMLHELYAAAAKIEALGGDASTQRAAIAEATVEA